MWLQCLRRQAGLDRCRPWFERSGRRHLALATIQVGATDASHQLTLQEPQSGARQLAEQTEAHAPAPAYQQANASKTLDKPNMHCQGGEKDLHAVGRVGLDSEEPWLKKEGKRKDGRLTRVRCKRRFSSGRSARSPLEFAARLPSEYHRAWSFIPMPP